jgi:hypothetical protein
MQHPSPLSNKTPPQDLDAAFRQVRLTHLAFLASTLIYGLVGILLKQFIMGAEPGFVGLDPSTYFMLLVLFIIISVGLGFVVLVVLPRRNSPQHLVKSEAVSSSAELGQALFKAHSIRIAMTEAIAIFGLVLFLLNGNLLHLLVFIGIAFVLLLLLIFPRKAEWAEAQTLIEMR